MPVKLVLTLFGISVTATVLFQKVGMYIIYYEGSGTLPDLVEKKKPEYEKANLQEHGRHIFSLIQNKISFFPEEICVTA